MSECISVSNDYDMEDMKFIYHRGLPFSCDNCAIEEKESMRKSEEMLTMPLCCSRGEVGINGRLATRFNQPD